VELKEQILAALEGKKGSYISGEALARAFFVSRNAVWKAIEALRKEGHRIEAVTNKGYRLAFDSDVLSPQSISACLGDNAGLFDILVEPSLPSTNTHLKTLAAEGAPEGTVVVALEQTAGRGRMGRSFFSPRGAGVYFSLLFRPKMSAMDATLVTTAAAVAVTDALKSVTGVNALIKWVNDVYVGEKKVCGILTEGSFNVETGGLDSIVLGIGINIEPPPEGFPEELTHIAAPLYGDVAPAGVKSRLIAAVLTRFYDFMPRLEEKPHLKDYRARMFLQGRAVEVVVGDVSRRAMVLGLDEEFRLLVRYDSGEQDALMSGEVRILPERSGV
jgi:BirA family biotin operon repressor/biotin-[acetyl-CoA-carboxylase] ligase